MDAASVDLDAIEKRIDLMRWSDRVDEATPGSLADVFWNHDLPALVSAVRVSVPTRASERARSASADVCVVGSPPGEVAADV